MEIKNSGVAIVLSFLWTGFGQLYAGRIPRGLIMMAAAPVVWFVGWTVGLAGLGALISGKPNGMGVLGLLCGPMPFAFWIWGMVDAKKLCDRHNADLKRVVTDVHGHPAVDRDSTG